MRVTNCRCVQILLQHQIFNMVEPMEEEKTADDEKLAETEKPEEVKTKISGEAEDKENTTETAKNAALDINEEGMDSDSSQNSTSGTNPSGKKKTPLDKIKRKRRKGGGNNGAKTQTNTTNNNNGNNGSRSKLQYKCSNFIKEDHKEPIFGVQFYQYTGKFPTV